MPGNTEGMTRHDLEAKIVKRCWEDEKFRKEFTADPAAAFVKYLEIPAAALPKIAVHQQEPGSWHIVLAARPANTGDLSEADLEKIAGGTTPVGGTVSLVSLSIYAATLGASASAGISLVSVNSGW
jgi:hypothetical protein